MRTETRIPLEEYLRSSYHPDREYKNGVVTERNVGDREHSLLQTALAAYLVRRRKRWQAYIGLRIQARKDWYPIPDLCVYPLPAPQERFPSRMPLLWIEILSADDRMIDVWEKARELVAGGSPYVWIINPHTLESELWTSAGPVAVHDKTLRLPDSPIVIPLPEVAAE